MASVTRTHQFVVFLNDDEKAALQALAAEDGTPASKVIRKLLTSEWERRREQPPRKPTKKPK